MEKIDGRFTHQHTCRVISMVVRNYVVDECKISLSHLHTTTPAGCVVRDQIPGKRGVCASPKMNSARAFSSGVDDQSVEWFDSTRNWELDHLGFFGFGRQ